MLGRGTAPDTAKAVTIIRPFAEAGHAPAENLLGTFISQNYALGVAPAEALPWMTRRWKGWPRSILQSGWPTTLIADAIVFGRDGKHSAFQATGADPRIRGIYLGGKFAAPKARGLYFPTLTPESQHSIYAADKAAAVPGQVPPIAVY